MDRWEHPIPFPTVECYHTTTFDGGGGREVTGFQKISFVFFLTTEISAPASGQGCNGRPNRTGSGESPVWTHCPRAC